MAETLLGRNQGILARINNLSPLEPKLKELFERGKRAQLSQGRTATGTPFAPLARSTLERGPRQSPLPFLKHGMSSSLIIRYQVTVQFAAASLTVSAGWPMKWVRYHVAGGRRLPRRDPTGFRKQDVDDAMKMFR